MKLKRAHVEYKMCIIQSLCVFLKWSSRLYCVHISLSESTQSATAYTWKSNERNHSNPSQLQNLFIHIITKLLYRIKTLVSYYSRAWNESRSHTANSKNRTYKMQMWQHLLCRESLRDTVKHLKKFSSIIKWD